MSALVVLAVLVLIAVLAPFAGADSRWEGAGTRPDRPRRAAPVTPPALRPASRPAPALRDV